MLYISGRKEKLDTLFAVLTNIVKYYLANICSSGTGLGNAAICKETDIRFERTVVSG